MALQGVLRTQEGGLLSFWCPGCEELHTLNHIWTFNGNFDKPTFAPSVLVTNGHYCSQHKLGDHCWCTFNERYPDNPTTFTCSRCHSFVRDGNIEFLTDSTHKLAGQTVALPVPP